MADNAAMSDVQFFIWGGLVLLVLYFIAKAMLSRSKSTRSDLRGKRRQKSPPAININPADVKPGGQKPVREGPNWRDYEPPLPDGMCVYVSTSVVGTSYRLDDVIAWMGHRKLDLHLSADPSNKRDKNAIMVIGSCEGRRGRQYVQVGFVDKDIARTIAKMKVPGGALDVRARLRRVRLADDESHAAIEFDIVGPAQHIGAFEQAALTFQKVG